MVPVIGEHASVLAAKLEAYWSMPASAASTADTRSRSKPLEVMVCTEMVTTAIPSRRTTMETMIAVTIANPSSRRRMALIDSPPSVGRDVRAYVARIAVLGVAPRDGLGDLHVLAVGALVHDQRDVDGPS